MIPAPAKRVRAKAPAAPRRQGPLLRLLGDRAASAGGAVVLCAVLVALLAPVLAPQDPLHIDLSAAWEAPSARHLLGADELGRDILSRIIYGSRTSLEIAIAGVAIALVLALLIGPPAGFYGGWLDRVLMRLMDVMLSFPSILLAIVIVAVTGPGLFGTLLAVGISSVPTFARLARGSTLSLRNEEYVTAARAVGATDAHIIVAHILPNLINPLVVLSTLRLSTMVLTVAALSFIGLGVQPPSPEWGTMMSEARPAIRDAPFAILFPGLALMLLILAFNVLGDGLRDALDPRQVKQDL
jgi:peptide/nickel transport system permease protein